MSKLLESNVAHQGLVLDLVYQLCKALEMEQIQYCHWKSNAALHRSASGENDLDLLVHRADAQRFTEILSRLGFKKAYPKRVKQMPGILDYYGYDVPSDRWVHVHVHYQLVLGHDRTKNYRLPVEDLFFASIQQQQFFKVPDPEVEFIIFVIRMILKYSTWDAILQSQGALPVSARNELEYLEERVNWNQVYELLRQYLPYISEALFNECAQSLHVGCSVGTRIKVGHQLQKQLHPYARRSYLQDLWLKSWRQISQSVQKRVLKQRFKKRLESGGAMIAIVGGDGAGKSTVVEELSAWLSKTFDTCTIHLGKPPRSRTTQLVRAALKISRRLGSLFRGRSHSSSQAPLLWHLCAARDRYLSYSRAYQFAANGGIVICDRFPLPQVELMDSPQIERLTTDASWGLIRYLAHLEQQWYHPFVAPDLLIVLKLDPEIAVQRKTTEPESHVRPRSTEVWCLDWQHTGANVIDANQPAAKVLADIKSLIWRRL